MMTVYLEIKARSFAECADCYGRVYIFGDAPLDVSLVERSEIIRKVYTGVHQLSVYELTDLGRGLAGV